MKSIKKITLSLLTIVAVFASQYSMAASTANSFTIGAFMPGTCIVSSTPVAFGAITAAPGPGNFLATGSAVVKCGTGIAYNVTTSVGTGASYADRSMGGTGGNTARLRYNIHTDVARNNISNGTISAETSKVGTGADDPFIFYAKMPTNQFIKADTYSDTINITVAY